MTPTRMMALTPSSCCIAASTAANLAGPASSAEICSKSSAAGCENHKVNYNFKKTFRFDCTSKTDMRSVEPHESATMAWIVTRQSRLFILHDKHSTASCKILSMNKTQTKTEIVNNQQTSSCLRLQSLQERLHGSRELMFSRMVTWTQPPPVCIKTDQ